MSVTSHTKQKVDPVVEGDGVDLDDISEFGGPEGRKALERKLCVILSSESDCVF
jgi:hypothetical protein